MATRRSARLSRSLSHQGPLMDPTGAISAIPLVETEKSAANSSPMPGPERPPSPKKQTCGICLDDVTERGIINCYCFECIVKWSEVANTCPMCKKRFQEIRRFPPIPHTAATTAADEDSEKASDALVSSSSKKKRPYVTRRRSSSLTAAAASSVASSLADPNLVIVQNKQQRSDHHPVNLRDLIDVDQLPDRGGGHGYLHFRYNGGSSDDDEEPDGDFLAALHHMLQAAILRTQRVVQRRRNHHGGAGGAGGAQQRGVEVVDLLEDDDSSAEERPLAALGNRYRLTHPHPRPPSAAALRRFRRFAGNDYNEHEDEDDEDEVAFPYQRPSLTRSVEYGGVIDDDDDVVPVPPQPWQHARTSQPQPEPVSPLPQRQRLRVVFSSTTTAAPDAHGAPRDLEEPSSIEEVEVVGQQWRPSPPSMPPRAQYAYPQPVIANPSLRRNRSGSRAETPTNATFAVPAAPLPHAPGIAPPFGSVVAPLHTTTRYQPRLPRPQPRGPIDLTASSAGAIATGEIVDVESDSEANEQRGGHGAPRTTRSSRRFSARASTPPFVEDGDGDDNDLFPRRQRRSKRLRPTDGQ